MHLVIKPVLACFVLLLVLTVIARDSSFHFNTDIIQVKREHRSAQRHWNIGYHPRYVYYDSPFRYQNDLRAISKIITPGYALLSDIATSYYAAATLPVYVLNVHRHHSSARSEGLSKALVDFCYLEDVFHRQAFKDYLQEDTRLSQQKRWPELRYVLLNKDKQNSMLRKECIALRSQQLESSLLSISQLLYEGEYLNIYQLL